MNNQKTTKLQPNGTPQLIINIVESNEKLTLDQLSQRIDRTRGNITQALVKLRKMGYHYHPVGIGDSRDKVVVDVTTEPAYYISTQEDYNRQINARVETQFSEMEVAYEKLPEVRKEIEVTLNERVKQFTGQRTWLKHLLGSGRKFLTK